MANSKSALREKYLQAVQHNTPAPGHTETDPERIVQYRLWEIERRLLQIERADILRRPRRMIGAGVFWGVMFSMIVLFLLWVLYSITLKPVVDMLRPPDTVRVILPAQP